MRSSLGLVGLLIAVAIVLYLFGHQAKKDIQEVRTVSLAVQDTTDGRPFGADAAAPCSTASAASWMLPLSPPPSCSRLPIQPLPGPPAAPPGPPTTTSP